MMHLRAIRSRQAGFTLMELLLTVGLLALLLAGMYQIMDKWMQRAVNRTAAADMLRVQIAAQDYVLANFEPLKTAPAGVFQEIDVEDLKDGNYLPAGYQPFNTFRQRIRVFRRNLQVERLNKDGTVSTDPDGNPVHITTIEVLTLSDDNSGGTVRVPNQRLLDSAQAGGPQMGVVSQIVYPGATFTGLVTSVYNEWYVQLSDLASAGYDASPDSQGGYLAAYGLVNAETTDVNDRWLYRVTIDGRPELNRMITDLHMNSQRMENVGTMIADRVNVTGNAAFRGISQGTTSETAQAMAVEQALRLDNTGEARINMRDTTGACTLTDSGGGNRVLSGSGCNITGGELQVVSGTNNAIMTIGTLTADGSIITDFTNVDQTTDSHGVASFENINGQDINASTTILAPTTTVTGNTVTTEQMQTATMSVNSGATIGNAAEPTIKLVAAQINPGGWDTAAGTDLPTARTMQTTQLDLGNAAELKGDLIADQLDVTDSLYLSDVVPAGYNDAYLNRRVICSQYQGRTYCEPSGSAVWYGGQFVENCTANTDSNGDTVPDSYTCDHYRQISTGYQYYGRCVHHRAVGASGQAYHVSDCN